MGRRRPPGQVRDAIIQFLRNARREASIKEICAGVSDSIGEVPASSVRSYLRLNTPGLFRRTGPGTYSIAKK